MNGLAGEPERYEGSLIEHNWCRLQVHDTRDRDFPKLLPIVTKSLTADGGGQISVP